MSAALVFAMFFTVALLATTAYFIMGSVPLLILRHDTLLDARFVRGFFNVYYRAAFFTAAGTAISLGFAGWPGAAAGAAALALIAVALRWKIIPRMDSLGARIQSNDIDAIARFRRMHIAAILMNVVQLVVVVWSLIALNR
jgi:hypothetical protein